MPRWDHDTVFYRVFCITLLAVAFTFTVILTNVFIDIDGLLYKRNKAKAENLEAVKNGEENAISNNFIPSIYKTYDNRDYGDYKGERTKRSLDTQDISFHLNDLKMKNVITNRLAALLDELDKESSNTNNNIEYISKPENAKNELHKGYEKRKYKEIKSNKEIINNNKAKVRTNEDKTFDIEVLDTSKKSIENIEDKIEILDDIERIKNEKDRRKLNNTEDELKHLAMHNIILQGIIGHMDLGDVYARMLTLINNLENTEVGKDNLKGILHPAYDKKFFNELMNCKKLREQVVEESIKREMVSATEKSRTLQSPGRNVMIKTIIDITSLTNEKHHQDDTISKENINEIIQLVYNGKSFKFRRVDEATTTVKSMMLRQAKEKTSADLQSVKDIEDMTQTKNNGTSTYVPNFMNDIIKEYLKKYSKESVSLENTKKFSTRRHKRNIKIRYENDDSTTEKAKVKGKDDDELYVEIETHFDSKGLKGEKKRKMIRDLIEKIQTAIHSDKQLKKKKHKHLHVKKRTQNPLDNGAAANKILSPLSNLLHRDLDPISKSMPLHEKLPHVSNNKGDDWRRDFDGPRYLGLSKAINSAELSELDTDFNRVLDNGIPQRLQKPLSSNDEALNNNVNDPKNVKFLLKDIAGSGFSIGFNQYVDEPPDAESMKLFTGIENIIQTYHQKYDEPEANADNANAEKINEEYPQTNDHTIVRRSIKKSERDYHSNEYKVIFNKNFLNYDNYQEVYNKGHWSDAKNSKTKNNIHSTLVIDDNIFEKDLKPVEIFSLANLLERKKRSINVKKISNIKSKKKLNRYLNTKAMASKMIFLQNKRSKRQIDKIRIIAKDMSKRNKHNSEEDIFVVSDEKIFADRAVVREVQTPETEQREQRINEEHLEVITPQQTAEENFEVFSPQKVTEEHYDIISPQKVNENHYDIILPYAFEAPSIESHGESIFTRRSRHNSLMSKYPHIFMEEISKSKEENDMNPNVPAMYGKIVEKYPTKVEITTQDTPTIVEVPGHLYKNPEVQEIVDAYPPQEKSNYKVTVKIMPKNHTGVNSGFKEVHTSINKSYNKNGLKYTSLVNVSEVSKVEKINKTKDDVVITHPSVRKLKNEQLRIKSLIQQHKDRIEEQLAHLNREKEKLERIDIRNAESLRDVNNDYVDVPLPTHPGRTLHITKEDLGKLLNFEENTTTAEPTTVPITTEYIQPSTEDPTKIQIINTIERNEKITNEILKKIDKNTDILQTFLDKLISKMEATTAKTTTKSNVYSNPEQDNNYEEAQQKNLNPQIPRTSEIYEQMPNIFFNQIPKKNGSNGIPFIYAFQQPFNTNKDLPIASVVYQGHIHANTVNYKKPEIQNSRKLWKEKDVIQNDKEWKTDTAKPVNILGMKNGTRFFIDDLENEYKVLPVVGKTTYPVGTVGITNGTKT